MNVQHFDIEKGNFFSIQNETFSRIEHEEKCARGEELRNSLN